MQWITFWTAVGAVAMVLGAIATSAAVLGILIAARQLRFEAWLKAQEVWVQKDFVRARGRIFSHITKPHDWDADDQEAALEVCRRMDEFCRLAPYFSFTESRGDEIVLDVWHNPLGKSWLLLQPLVVTERDVVEWQTKWDAFEHLGKAAAGRLTDDTRTKLETLVKRLGPAMEQLRRS